MSRVIQIGENRSILKGLFFCVFIFVSAAMNAQADKKYIRKGNREYEKNKFSDSEISYKKAVDENKQYPDAVFNVGDALYKQKKFEEAGSQFVESTNENYDRIKKSAGLYNLGNSLIKANKLQESIDAYENSLKLRPDNHEAKYNLAYAQDLLKQQQKKQQQDKKKQDQNKDKNKQDQKKDQKDQNDKNKDQKKDQNTNKDQKQQQQPREQEISKEDAQRLLNSMANDEKNVQEKVKLAKATKSKVRTRINW
jgi:tetratricopeptide (TPR) repeat protein